VEILQLPALTSLLFGEYPATELLWTVNSTIAPSLQSLPCTARLNCQPSAEFSHKPTNCFTLLHSTELHSRLRVRVGVGIRVTLRLAVYRQSVRLSAKSLETHDQVCRLQLLLAFTSAVILRSKSRGTHDIFYCLRLQTFPTWRARSPYLYPPGTEWPSYTPRHWVPFSSPPATRESRVERPGVLAV
jgi:hypothetical protein